jgi:serpin B
MKTNILILLLAILFTACELSEDPKLKINKELTNKSAELIVAENNKFALEFFKKVSEFDTATNNMVSPVSLSLALGMAYNGAEGDTKAAFDEVLDYPATLTEVNEFNQNLIRKLSSSEDGSVMEIANSMWIHDGFPVKEDFINLNREYYQAEVANLDFSDPASVDVINNWVSNKTHDKIPTIINEISADMRLFLINALYFNAAWMYEFNKEFTEQGTFIKDNGNEMDVEMMTMTENLNYFKNDLFSSVILPYEKEKFSMVILLPNAGKTTGDVIGAMDHATWTDWMESYDTIDVSVNLPKFKLEYKNMLNDELIDMGLGIAFSGAADFSGISDIALKIAYVLQKTFIDVNEEGTEAAAVTIIGFENTSMPSGNLPELFIVNRPFVYAIKENVTGSICFMGKVGAPEYEEE